jgi:hypothetical protein
MQKFTKIYISILAGVNGTKIMKQTQVNQDLLRQFSPRLIQPGPSSNKTMTKDQGDIFLTATGKPNSELTPGLKESPKHELFHM